MITRCIFHDGTRSFENRCFKAPSTLWFSGSGGWVRKEKRSYTYADSARAAGGSRSASKGSALPPHIDLTLCLRSQATFVIDHNLCIYYWIYSFHTLSSNDHYIGHIYLKDRVHFEFVPFASLASSNAFFTPVLHTDNSFSRLAARSLTILPTSPPSFLPPPNPISNSCLARTSVSYPSFSLCGPEGG